MRPTCTFCARKHLGQASALLSEARQGYPDHVWLAIGHLSEAADELVQDHPAMANEIRDHRKRLETDVSYDVPVMELIRKTSALAQPDTTPEQRTVSPAIVAVPCLPCEEAKKKLRNIAAENECLLMGEGKPYCGRLVIVIPLGDFKPSFSLCSVAFDQALAARLVGYRVHIWVNEGCDTSKLAELPPGLTIDKVLPAIHLKRDEVVEADVQSIVEVFQRLLKPMYAHGQRPHVVTHDLVFQADYIVFAAAMHRLAEQGFGAADGAGWWHMAHSSVGARPPEDVAKYRASLPAGHRLLAVNYADVPFLRGYYQVLPAEADRVQTLLNPRDPRAFLRMPYEATLIITRYGLLQRDVVQVYPVSGTRMMDKGLDKLVLLFGALAQADATVALVVVNAHSNNDKAEHSIKHLRNLAASCGLPAHSLIFTSEELPDTAVTGLDGDSIRSLFSISNLFAFPTISEAGSLVLLEAMMSQCLLVLNDSLPCLADYVPRSLGMWVAWGSIKGVGQPFILADVAAQILERLDADERMAIRRALFRRSSTEAYGEALKALLEGREVG